MTEVRVNKSHVFKQAHKAFGLMSEIMDFSDILFIEWMMAKRALRDYRPRDKKSDYILIS